MTSYSECGRPRAIASGRVRWRGGVLRSACSDGSRLRSPRSWSASWSTGRSGSAILGLKFAQRRGYTVDDALRRCRAVRSFGRVAVQQAVRADRSGSRSSTAATGNAAFDEWRAAELAKLDEERRKLDAAQPRVRRAPRQPSPRPGPRGVRGFHADPRAKSDAAEQLELSFNHAVAAPGPSGAASLKEASTHPLPPVVERDGVSRFRSSFRYLHRRPGPGEPAPGSIGPNVRPGAIRQRRSAWRDTSSSRRPISAAGSRRSTAPGSVASTTRSASTRWRAARSA